MAENTGIDLIKGPIQLATQMIQAQNDRITRQLQGPEREERRVMVGDIPLESIMPSILAQMEIK